MKNLISLCMIVKNEDKVIDRCLKSVQNIVDEIIILDTGSTDSTKDIVSQYTNKIFDYTWEDDFSKARNLAAEKATGEWILILDADEFVDSTNLKQVIELLSSGLMNNYDSLIVKINNFLGDMGEQIIQHKSERLYKNFQNIYFERAIHEQLKKNEGTLLSSEIDLIVYHSGYLNKTHQEKNKTQRNAPLIEKELLTSKNIAFDNFNLGNELFSQGKILESLKCYQNAFMKKSALNLSWVGMSVVQIVNCLMRLHKNNDALEVIKDAEQIWENNVDFACLKASIFLKQKRYNDAKEVLINILKLKEDQKKCIMNLRFKDFYPMKLLGEVYYINKEYNKSIEYFVKAHNIFEKDLYVSHMIQKLLIEESLPVKKEIYEFLNKINLLTHEKDKYNFLKLVVGNNGFFDYELFEMVEIKSHFKEFLLLFDRTRNAKINTTDVIDYESLINQSSLTEMVQDGYVNLNELLYLNIIFNTDYFTKYYEKNNSNTLSEYINIVNNDGIISLGILDSYVDLLSYFLKFNNVVIGEKLFLKLEKVFSNSFAEKKLKEQMANIFFENNYMDLSYEKFKSLDTLEISEESLLNLFEIYESQKMFDIILDIILERLEKKSILSFDILLRAFKIALSLNRINDKNTLEKYLDKYYPGSNEMKDFYIFGIN